MKCSASSTDPLGLAKSSDSRNATSAGNSLSRQAIDFGDSPLLQLPHMRPYHWDFWWFLTSTFARHRPYLYTSPEVRIKFHNFTIFFFDLPYFTNPPRFEGTILIVRHGPQCPLEVGAKGCTQLCRGSSHGSATELWKFELEVQLRKNHPFWSILKWRGVFFFSPFSQLCFLLALLIVLFFLNHQIIVSFSQFWP